SLIVNVGYDQESLDALTKQQVIACILTNEKEHLRNKKRVVHPKIINGYLQSKSSLAFYTLQQLTLLDRTYTTTIWNFRSDQPSSVVRAQADYLFLQIGCVAEKPFLESLSLIVNINVSKPT